MKRIVLSLFILAMILAGCEKVEHQLGDLVTSSKEKVESIDKIQNQTADSTSINQTAQNVKSAELQYFRFWRSFNDTSFQYPLYSPLKIDSMFDYGNYQPFLYWRNYQSPLLQPDSLKQKP